MKIRILTIAAATAIAVTAFGFNAPASAAPLGLASQTIAQSAAQSLDSPVLEINRKGGNRGKWGGNRGKWHGHKGKWRGHKGKRHFRYRGHRKFHFGLSAPYYYDPCYTQVVVDGRIALINIC